MELTELNSIYNDWKRIQGTKAYQFFANPFTGKIDKENEITYLHKFVIGGSTDSILLGANKYQTVADAYNNMTTFERNDDKFVFRRGHALEPFVASEFTELTKIRVQEGTSYKNDDYSWSFAQVDYLTLDNVPLEIKVSTAPNREQEDGLKLWGKGCEFTKDGDLIKTDNLIPIEYLIQCQKQMWLGNHQSMWLAVWLTWETKIRVFKIDRDDALIEKIKNAEIDFLFNHVIPQKPYTKEQAESTLDVVDEEPNCCYADEELLNLCRRYNTLSKNKKDLEDQFKNVQDSIKSMLGHYSMAINNKGSKVVSLTPQKRETLDAKKLTNFIPKYFKSLGLDMPEDFISQFYVTKEIAPKLTITKDL